MATTGAASRALDARGTTVGRAARRLSTETKQAFKTSEFWAMIALVLAILVSAALIKGGDNGTDEFIARQAWPMSILGAGSFISRGLASPATASPTPTTKAIAAPVTIATDPLQRRLSGSSAGGGLRSAEPACACARALRPPARLGRRHRALITVAGSLATAAVLVLVLAGRRHKFEAALWSAAPWMLALTRCCRSLLLSRVARLGT